MTLSAQALASYQKELEKQETYYGAPVAVAALRCFRRYHPMARFDTVDRNGRQRWMTAKMMRIEAILLRIGTSGSGYTKTREIAAEAQCSPGYVSKMVDRFEVWGTIGLIRTRGRYGKLFIFARVAGDMLDQLVADGRRRLHEAKVRRHARKMRRATNVSSDTTYEVDTGRAVTTYKYVMEETLVVPIDFDGLTPFVREVLHERARLAMDDPKGEEEAVAPLSYERALELFNRTIVRRVERKVDLAGPLGIDPSKGHGRVPCPAHGEGKKGSISWRMDGDLLLIHCFAGCTFDEIRRAATGG